MTDHKLFCDKLTKIFTHFSLDKFLNDRVAEDFFRLTERMLEVNSYMNLTAITDLEGIILKHYADSLTICDLLPEGSKVIDIGCGAGFPSLPLAIVRRDLQVTSLDSTGKRIRYIEETAHMLGLNNLTAVTARAEEAGKAPEYREKYDFACARAVARMNVLCELSIPFVKVGGSFIAMKSNVQEELPEAEKAIKLLGGRIKSQSSFELGDAGHRTNVEIEKIAPTPTKYPRNNSQISKKPL